MMIIAIRMNGVMIIQIPTLVFTIIENGKNSSINLKKTKRRFKIKIISFILQKKPVR